MKIRALGHLSLFVRDLEATRRFYRDLLGLAETGSGKDGRIVFFSAGARHHDLSCELARAPGPGPQPKGVPGLYHVAFEVGNRHFTLAIDDERLLVLDDPAMDQLLTRLGVDFERRAAVFVPVGPGHGHDH